MHGFEISYFREAFSRWGLEADESVCSGEESFALSCAPSDRETRLIRAAADECEHQRGSRMSHRPLFERFAASRANSAGDALNRNYG